MTTYSNIDSIPNIWTRKRVNDNLTKHFFKWYECGILGCGANSLPFLNLEQYVQIPKDSDSVIEEINSYLDSVKYAPGGSTCLMPKEINGYDFLTHYQWNSKKYIPQEVMNSFTSIVQYDKWVIDNLGIPVWQVALVIRSVVNNTWSIKHTEGQWNNFIKDPETSPFCRLVDSLRQSLFVSIGRIMIYRCKAGLPVPIHRDHPATGSGHRAHFVTIQLTNPNRPAFVYDEITKEKIYSSSYAYMFNESDCHGVDAEDESNFTIRIDGTFKPEVCSQLDLVDGLVYCNKYKNSYKFDQIKVIEL